jgi:hypothetical protein
MRKYDKNKMTYRNESYDNERKVRTQNALCDIASEISELKEAMDRFSELCKRPSNESLIKKIWKWGRN